MVVTNPVASAAGGNGTPIPPQSPILMDSVFEPASISLDEKDIYTLLETQLTEDQVCEKEELDLLIASRKGDDYALQYICERYKPLLIKCASMMEDRRYYEDIYASLSVRLIEAIYKFDMTRKVPFPAYIKHVLRGAALDYCKRHYRYVNRELQVMNTADSDDEGLFMSLFSVEDTTMSYEHRQIIEITKQALHNLLPFEQYIIHEYYHRKKTLADIASELGRTKQDIAYHHKRILTKLYNMTSEQYELLS